MASEIRELKSVIMGFEKYFEATVSTEKFISKKELAKRLGISEWKVTEMTREKTIPHQRAGTRYLYNYQQVLKSIGVKQRKN